MIAKRILVWAFTFADCSPAGGSDGCSPRLILSPNLRISRIADIDVDGEGEHLTRGAVSKVV